MIKTFCDQRYMNAILAFADIPRAIAEWVAARSASTRTATGSSSASGTSGRRPAGGRLPRSLRSDCRRRSVLRSLRNARAVYGEYHDDCDGQERHDAGYHPESMMNLHEVFLLH
jgi:hypothetical protein